MNAEYEHVKLAMEALESAYRAVFLAVHVGMEADEIDAILSEELKTGGTELLPSKSSPFVVAEDGVPPKLRLNRIPLKRGRLWGLDNNVRREGYYADLGRYGYIGDLPETLASEHTHVLERQNHIAAAIQPGRTMEEIFLSCPDDMPFEIHRIGQEQTMPPVCGNATPNVLEGMERSQSEGLVFEPGQVICVEIWAGLRGGIEDMYIVESNGIERISSLPREIQVVPEEKQ